LGRSWDDPRIEKVLKSLKFVAKGADSRVMISLFDGMQLLRPEEVSAEVLSALRDIADEALGTHSTANAPLQAVLTHPAYFDQQQIEATQKAAEIANIHVVEYMTEPQAAAYAFGFNNERIGSRSDATPYRLMTFDLGGGTFDTTVVEIDADGTMMEVGIDGDGALGGRDFDAALISWVVAKTRVADKSRRILARLVKDCEAAKIELSKKEEIT
jgi:molecular chaperone DnaK (HSP70)